MASSQMYSSTPSSPSVYRADQSYEFSVPSVPPRLAKIGRRISQMGENFLPPEPTVPSRRGSHVPDVPGMGDEPVMCPFCNKPLPPALFVGHHHPPPRRIATPRASIAESRKESVQESSPLPAQQKLLDALPVASPVVASSESLVQNVTAAELADTEALKAIIDPADLKRWLLAAGLETEAPDNIQSEKLAPTLPGPTSQGRSMSSSSRFGFFGRGSKNMPGDNDSDDDGGGPGYTRLIAPGSPSDDDDTNDKSHRLHEPITSAKKQEEGFNDGEPISAEPRLRASDLKSVLQEVLRKIDEMVSYNFERLLMIVEITKQSALVTFVPFDFIEDRSIKSRNGGSQYRDARSASQADPLDTARTFRCGSINPFHHVRNGPCGPAIGSFGSASCSGSSRSDCCSGPDRRSCQIHTCTVEQGHKSGYIAFSCSSFSSRSTVHRRAISPHEPAIASLQFKQ